MQLKRPYFLFLQRREQIGFSLQGLLSGGDGLVHGDQWLALAPHLGTEVVLESQDLAVLEAFTGSVALTEQALALRFGADRIRGLVEAGLLIGDHAAHAPLRQRDQALRDGSWWGPAALAQAFGRRPQSHTIPGSALAESATWTSMVREHGPPPPETLPLRAVESWLPLPPARRTAFDTLLNSRTTCRNFDPRYELPLVELATLLHRVFGAQARQEFLPSAAVLKKNSPSGGGLHPIEAYLLVQRVQGLGPGVYHYHAGAHVLEPMSELSGDAASARALELVAGQGWFANAPVLVLLAARFQRSFWKYRNDRKVWRVIQLDAGHLSQNFYLSASEQGFGAFVTGAIDDGCAEQLFEIDGLEVGSIAVCGVGRRAAEASVIELDPLHRAVR